MKEDFDDILRKKWEERQFPVDQSHRADMIRLLDQNNRRRTGVLWWFFGVGISCAVVALFVILNDAEKLDKAVEPIEGETAIEAKAHASANKVQDAQVEIVDENEPDSRGSEGELRHAVKAHTSAAEAYDINAETDGKNETETHGSDGELQHAEKAMLRPAITQPRATAQQPADNSNAKTKASNKEKEQIIASTNGIVKSNDDKNELNTNSSNPSDNTAIVNSVETKEISVPVVSPIEVESTTNPVGTANETTPLVLRNDFVTDPIDALAFGNIDFSSNNEIGNVEPVIIKHHPVWLYAEAGAGFVPAPKSNIKSGYTLRAGGGVGYGLSARQSLTMSGGYLMQKNGFDFQRSSTVQQSGFGARSNFNTLTPDKLHFVYARLGVHHRIKRHMISVFGGGQYLYGAQGFVVVKSDDQLTGISEKTKYAWLKLDGMNRLWWNAELNYGYQLTPRFSIQAGVKYSFTSLVATDQELIDEGYYWKGDLSSLSPSFTINYHLYGKR